MWGENSVVPIPVAKHTNHSTQKKNESKHLINIDWEKQKWPVLSSQLVDGPIWVGLANAPTLFLLEWHFDWFVECLHTNRFTHTHTHTHTHTNCYAWASITFSTHFERQQVCETNKKWKTQCIHGRLQLLFQIRDLGLQYGSNSI